VYIRSDGSIYPQTAPIRNYGKIYILTDDIYNKTLVVEKDHIIIDGNGCTIQGTKAYRSVGLDLSNREGVIVKNLIIGDFYYGILLNSSRNNTICRNTILGCTYTIYGSDSRYNKIYHNNFLTPPNKIRAGRNIWDDGYPSGGNYWGGYVGEDLYSGPYQNIIGSDGISDSIRDIDEDNFDRYPLMGIIHFFNIITQEETYYISIVSNYIISSFAYNFTTHTISFDTTESSESIGFCRLCIPHALMKEPYKITVAVDNQNPSYVNDNLYDNGTHRWIYFSYEHTKHVTVRTIAIDNMPPKLTIISPENKTYTINSLNLTFTTNEQLSWISYSFDNKANVTITGNITMVDLPEGVHFIKIYAMDLSGNMGSSDLVYFTVSIPSHDLAVLSVNPSLTEIHEGDLVNITVIIQNNGGFTETFNVTIYANNTAIQTKTISEMAPETKTTLTFTWKAIGFPPGNYIMKAEVSTTVGEMNVANNVKVNGVIHIISKFPSIPVLLLLIIALSAIIAILLAVIIYRRGHHTCL
jgi:parallel beta-helix repeat protein